MLWCDKFTGIHDSQWTASEICRPPKAWDSGTVLCDLSFFFFSFFSIYLSPICLPVCLCSPSKFRCSSHTNANSLTHSMRVSICTSARNQHLFLSVSLSSPASHYFTCAFPLQQFAGLRSHPIWVASQGTQIMCPFVNCLDVDTKASALTRPVIVY